MVQRLLDSPRGTICRLIQIVLLLAHVKPSSTIQAHAVDVHTEEAFGVVADEL